MTSSYKKKRESVKNVPISKSGSSENYYIYSWVKQRVLKDAWWRHQKSNDVIRPPMTSFDVVKRSRLAS